MGNFDDYLEDLYDDMYLDMLFEGLPENRPNPWWMDKYGKEHRVTEMTDDYIINCMKFVGKGDPWYDYFMAELKRRKTYHGRKY